MAEDTTSKGTETAERVADDTTTAEQQPGKPDVPPEVKRALSKANREAETLRLKLKEYEDRDKTEHQKLAEQHQDAEQRAAAAELRATRLEVAAEKGLTPAQAKRLVGTTREELEADADEVLRDFPVTSLVTTPAGPKPDPAQGARPGTSGGSVAAGAALYEQRNQRKTTVT